MDQPVRILIEHPHALVRLDLTEELESAGFDVDACRGPDAGPCPLVNGRGCPEAERADLIINGLGGDQLDVYLAERTLLPDTPICVDVSDGCLDQLTEVLRDVHSTGPIPMTGSLVERVRELLER